MIMDSQKLIAVPLVNYLSKDSGLVGKFSVHLQGQVMKQDGSGQDAEMAQCQEPFARI